MKFDKYLIEITKFEKDNNVKAVGLNQLKKGDVVLLDIGDRTNFTGGKGLKYGLNEFIFDKLTQYSLFLKKDGKTYKFEITGQNLKPYRKNK